MKHFTAEEKENMIHFWVQIDMEKMEDVEMERGMKRVRERETAREMQREMVRQSLKHREGGRRTGNGEVGEKGRVEREKERKK